MTRKIISIAAFSEPTLKTHHFHGRPLPLSDVLFALAAQEGNDGDEGNAMQAAGEFIRSVTTGKPMTRKIISIAAFSESDSFWPILVALCDDGTLWQAQRDRHGFDPWVKSDLPPIPQDGELT